MFTGIIEEIGEVTAIRRMGDGLRLTISARKILEDTKIDDSICIDGACQTVVQLDERSFTVEAVGETLEKTTLGSFRSGRKVNLERSLTLQTRLGGHLVQGHVNGTGRIAQWHARAENYYLEINPEDELLKYCIREGSVAVDGISLTVAALNEKSLGMSIIPHTVEQTTLKEKKIGDIVNIEVDVIARYVERFLTFAGDRELTMDKLKKWGY